MNTSGGARRGNDERRRRPLGGPSFFPILRTPSGVCMSDRFDRRWSSDRFDPVSVGTARRLGGVPIRSGAVRPGMSASPPGYQLGIDYGTSNTVAVLRGPDVRVRPLLFDGFPLLPSAVFANPDGSLISGRDAVRSASLAPACYEPHVKRRIDDLDVLLGQRPFPVVDLIATTLRRVAAEAVQAAGAQPAAVCLTYPVAWGPARRSALLQAAQAAGLPQPVLVPEPVAAASYLAAVGGGVRSGDCMVVYDLGAGTFDVSVVCHTPAGFETLASRGLDDFGGLDLDAQVVANVGRTLAGRSPDAWRRLTTPTGPSDLRHFRTLWNDAREVKEALTRQSSAGLYVTLAETDVMVTREEYERAALPLLARTVEVADRCVREARVPRERIAALFLVGGASRTPMVATLLHRALGLAPTITEQPETVVAEGALTLVAPVRDPLRAPARSGRITAGAARVESAGQPWHAPAVPPPDPHPVTPAPTAWPRPPTPLDYRPEPPPPDAPPTVDEFVRRRGVIVFPSVTLTLLGLAVSVFGLFAVGSSPPPEEVFLALLLLLIPGGAILTTGLTLLGRSLTRHRLRIGPDGVVARTGDPAPGDRLRMLGPLVAGVAMIFAGPPVADQSYTDYEYNYATSKYEYVIDSTAYHPAAAGFVMVGIAWLAIAVRVGREAAIRSRRWRRDIVVEGGQASGRRSGGPVYAECRFPWHAVDFVTVRRVGVWRAAQTVLIGAPPDSDLHRTPATAETFRPSLQAFSACDLSASVMPVDEVIVALRRHGGDRWRHS